ncbi:Ig-like domain-containing protein [Hydrogenimonas sp.]
MRRRILTMAIALIAALGMGGCGGGGGDSSAQTRETVLRGVAQLGYVAGGTVELYAYGDEDRPLASARTLEEEGEYGRFVMEGVRLPAEEFFVLKVTGGKDVDPDDDGVVKESDAVDVNGSVYAIVSRRELEGGEVRITALTDMAFRRLEGTKTDRLGSALDEEARSLLDDVDGDGRVDAADLQKFDPVLHRDRTRIPYAQILQNYVEPIEQGASRERILASLFALRPPKIVVEGGLIREAPAKIAAELEGVPAGVSVRWSLDGEAKERLDETLATPGTREIVAELFVDGELVGRQKCVVTLVESRSLGAKEATPREDTLLAVASSETDESLAGTTVVVPAGAVTEPVRVAGSRAEGGAIPHEADRIPVTEVLRLEPAGQTFEKPVRVTLPYDPKIVGDPTLIEIVRYSEGGEADVIAPLFVDEESAEIVFETDHFTYFQGKTTFSVTDLNKYVPGRKTGDEKFVDELNREFPEYSRSISEWKEVLNTPLRDDGKVTVYDYLRSYQATKRMYKIVQNGDSNEKFYSQALRVLFPDILEVTRDLQLWNDIKDGFDAMNLVSGAGSAALKISEGGIEIYKALLEQLGIPTAPTEMQIYDPVSVGGKIIASVTDSAINEHLSQYFEYRNGFYDASTGRFDYANLGVTLDADLAYFRSQNILWAAESMVRRYEAFDPQKDHIRAEETIAAAVEYAKRQKELMEAAENKRALFVQNGVNMVYYEPGESVKIPYEMKLYGYDNSPLLAIEVRDTEGKVLVERSESKGSICSIVEKGLLESVCRGEFELDTAKVDGESVIRLKAYREGYLLLDSDLQTETFVHLKRVASLAVEEVETAIAYDEEYDEVRIDVRAGFSGGVDAPCSVDLIDATGWRIGKKTGPARFVLDRETALGFGMERVRVRIEPASEKYRFEANEVTIDLKSRVEEALEAARESDEGESGEGVMASCLPVFVSASGADVEAGVDETTGWKLRTDTCPVASILSAAHGCKVVGEGSLECGWSAAGIYRPYVKVLLPDGRVEKVTARHKATVTEAAQSGNLAPIVEEQTIVAKEGEPREFELEFFDPEGAEGVSIETLTKPLYGTLESLGEGRFRYTPGEGFAGEDTFLFRAYDGESYSRAARARIVVERQVRPRSLRYRAETEPYDGAWVEKGMTFEKSWSFLNPDGNRELEDLKAVTIADGCGFAIVPQITPPSEVRSGQSFTVGYRFQVPADAADGSCEILFELRDGEGTLLYEDGARARFFLKLRVHEALPSGVRLLPVDGGVAGSVFLFRAQTAEPLPEGYALKLSLGDGGGGWLDPVAMVASDDARNFSLAQRVSRPGERRYRVAIFLDGEPLSEWVEGSYRVYEVSEKVTDLTVTRTDEGALLAWSPAEGASTYRPMYSLSFEEEGPFADMTDGCDFRSATSCLVPASRFAEQKRWFFRVEPDIGLASDTVEFLWSDENAPDIDDNDAYGRYLAGRTLYREDGYIVRFDANLTKMTILDNEGNVSESVVERTQNGLRVGGAQSSEYLVIVEADDTRVLIENAELTEGGVYISHNGTMAYYFENPAGLPDLEGVLVENALYLHCAFGDERSVGKFFFAADGRLLISWEGDDTQEEEGYRISGNLLETYDEEGSETHKAVEVTDDFIRFEEEEGDFTTLFFSYEKAAASDPVDCSDEGRRIEVSGIVSGTVLFYDENNRTVAVPSDAWVGITAESQKSSWNRLTCPVDATGRFGDRCYIEEDEEGVRRAFADASETFQLVVFKNHIEPENSHWNCGEDLYRYVGGSVPHGEWSRIEVRPSDYESRAGEACDGMDEGGSEEGPVVYDGFEGEFMNSSYCLAGAGDRVLVGVGGTVEGWHGESYPLQLLVVLDERESRVKCFMYDFHHYYDGQMGGGQSGTDHNEPQLSSLEADRLRLDGSYDFVFDGTLSESGLYEGTWRQSASEINGEYDGSGSFRIELVELNATSATQDPEGPDLAGVYLPRTLISPNGGESWRNGEARELRWDAGAFSGERIEAYVLHDDPAPLLEALQSADVSRIREAAGTARWYRFVENAYNSGNVGLDPEIMAGSGNAYMVLIVSDRGEWDVSDGTFSLNDE